MVLGFLGAWLLSKRKFMTIFRQEFFVTEEPVWLVPEEFAKRFSKKLSEIDSLAKEVAEHTKSLSAHELSELRDAQIVRSSRHSLEQEGIRVQPEEAVEQYINCFVPGIPPETRKALEGHFSAENLVGNWATRGKPLSMDAILDVHTVLMGRVNPEISGKLRTGRAIRPELPEGFRFPEPTDVKNHIAGFEKRLDKSQDHPVMKAIFTQLAVYRIHPFADGNSRTSRLMQNMILLREGYLPAVVPEGLYVQHRKHLNGALEPGWGEKKAAFFDFMIDMERQALESFVNTYIKKQPVKDDILKDER